MTFTKYFSAILACVLLATNAVAHPGHGAGSFHYHAEGFSGVAMVALLAGLSFTIATLVAKKNR